MPLPRLQLRYGHALALDDTDVFSGGHAAFTAPLPAVLPPQTAVVLGR
jgi:hypothetical protein